MTARLLRPGLTCGEIARARRVGVLFDADQYYRTLREALLRARHSVLILAWDIDSRIPLVRGDERADGHAVELAALLHEVTSAQPQLHVRILAWDYSPIFVFERETWARQRFHRCDHQRVCMRFDARHPPGASQHEKIVVVDDRIAFCGGLDLCDARWDRPTHDPRDPLRVDLRGHGYRPHHDMQMIVDGDAARALGRLARERWAHATGEQVEPAPLPGRPGWDDPWPPEAPIDLRDVDVGVARTRPEPEGAGPPAVREVERLWIESIAAARDVIYIETPYASLHAVTRALMGRLREPSGPEVVLVSSPTCNGWMENATMLRLRDEIVAGLREADEHGRFLALQRVEPDAGGGRDTPVNVHAKVCIVDDLLLRIGSANLTERSMALDSECDLAVEARTQESRAAVRRIRDRLIGEHAHVAPEVVAARVQAVGSVRGAIEAFARETGTLLPQPHRPPRIMPRAELVDPGHPLTVAQLGKVLLHTADRRSSTWRHLAIAWWVIGAALLVLANAMDWIDARAAMVWLAEVGSTRAWAPFAVAAVFAVSGMMFVPVTLMIANCGLLFGPGLGGSYALLGALSSATLYYWIGRGVGRDIVFRLAGARVREATRAVARRGLLAVVAVRVLPIAPHLVVGLAAGASRIGFRDYLLGTLIAMIPGGVVLVIVGSQAARGLDGVEWSTFGWGLLAAGIALATGWALQRWVGQGTDVHRSLDDLDGIDDERRPSIEPRTAREGLRSSL
jgi:phospholipase D1/2